MKENRIRGRTEGYKSGLCKKKNQTSARASRLWGSVKKKYLEVDGETAIQREQARSVLLNRPGTLGGVSVLLAKIEQISTKTKKRTRSKNKSLWGSCGYEERWGKKVGGEDRGLAAVSVLDSYSKKGGGSP